MAARLASDRTYCFRPLSGGCNRLTIWSSAASEASPLQRRVRRRGFTSEVQHPMGWKRASGDTSRNSFRQEGVATMAYHQLTREERYLIASGLLLNLTLRDLATLLGRAPSTVSREVCRNATTHDGAYRTEKANSYAVARRKRSRRGSRYSE